MMSSEYGRRVYYQAPASTRDENASPPRSGYEEQTAEEKLFTSDEIETPFAGNHYPVRTPISNGPPPTFVTRITNQNLVRRPVGPMAMDQTDASQESTNPSLANQPLPPPPKGKYSENHTNWGASYVMDVGQSRKVEVFAPHWLGIVFVAAAIICFMASAIPLIIYTWDVYWQIQGTGYFYSSQLGYYVLLIALGLSIWYSTVWQYPILIATICTIIAYRLPTVLLGTIGAILFLGYFTGTQFNEAGGINQYGLGSLVVTKDDYEPSTKAAIIVCLIEFLVDVALLILCIACCCCCVSKSMLNTSTKLVSLAIIVLACLATIFDTLPQHFYLIEATVSIKPTDQFASFNNIQTGAFGAVVSQQETPREECRNIFSPVPETLWKHFSGSVSPYFFTIFVVFLAIAPPAQKHHGSYASLVRTVSCVCLLVMTVAQIGILISRSYVMSQIMEKKDYLVASGGPSGTGNIITVQEKIYNDCIERLIGCMILSRVFVLLLCIAIGVLMLFHARAKTPKVDTIALGK